VTLRLIRFIYYLSKFWELLDSLFQLQKARSLGSKGSPPVFLHYFHHAAVMVCADFSLAPCSHAQLRKRKQNEKRFPARKFTRLDQVMCLNWLESNQSLQWLGLAFNTFVHVIMYVRHASLFIMPSLPVCRVIDFVFFERAP
jgi:hypothetical protein